MARTANASTSKASPKRTSAATRSTKAAANQKAPNAESVKEREQITDCTTNVTESNPPKAEAQPVEPVGGYRVRETIDPDMYVPVRNGFQGKLIYKSRKTGERYVWEKFGDEQDMELRELRAAKTSYKAFFENNWFLIDDPEVISYLGVERFYANALNYKEFDTLFELPPDEIEERISKLSDGQKSSLKYRAKELIRDGGIDSIKVINVLEKMLNTVLIER